MPSVSDLASPRHPLPAGASITPEGQRPDQEPSLAVRNNGGVPPSREPAPRGRRDALLVLGFGGPEGHDDVMPFLENVTRGRGIPRERLTDVAEHYHHFGGVSPINEQNKALVAALAAGLDLPVYWGNRNWRPTSRTPGGRWPRTGSSTPTCWRRRPTRRSPDAASTTRTSPGPGSR